MGDPKRLDYMTVTPLYHRDTKFKAFHKLNYTMVVRKLRNTCEASKHLAATFMYFFFATSHEFLIIFALDLYHHFCWLLIGRVSVSTPET